MYDSFPATVLCNPGRCGASSPPPAVHQETTQQVGRASLLDSPLRSARLTATDAASGAPVEAHHQCRQVAKAALGSERLVTAATSSFFSPLSQGSPHIVGSTQRSFKRHRSHDARQVANGGHDQGHRSDPRHMPGMHGDARQHQPPGSHVEHRHRHPARLENAVASPSSTSQEGQAWHQPLVPTHPGTGAAFAPGCVSCRWNPEPSSLIILLEPSFNPPSWPSLPVKTWHLIITTVFSAQR